VSYAAVAGQLDPSSPLASATSRRLAARSYAAISGDPAVVGDGLVPVSSALLAGAEHLVLDGVAHGGAFGSRWYGTPEVVDQWWGELGDGSGGGRRGHSYGAHPRATSP
jgi:hypothetical protein